MKKHLCVLVLTFGSIAVLLTGCASVVVPQPAKITIQEAMKQVGEGLKSMKEAQGGLRTGLVPDELEVTFNVTASGEQGGKLTLEATPIITMPNIGGKLNLAMHTPPRGVTRLLSGLRTSCMPTRQKYWQRIQRHLENF